MPSSFPASLRHLWSIMFRDVAFLRTVSKSDVHLWSWTPRALYSMPVNIWDDPSAMIVETALGSGQPKHFRSECWEFASHECRLCTAKSFVPPPPVSPTKAPTANSCDTQFDMTRFLPIQIKDTFTALCGAVAVQGIWQPPKQHRGGEKSDGTISGLTRRSWKESVSKNAIGLQ